MHTYQLENNSSLHFFSYTSNLSLLLDDMVISMEEEWESRLDGLPNCLILLETPV